MTIKGALEKLNEKEKMIVTKRFFKEEHKWK